MNEDWKRGKYLTFLNYNKKQYLELLKERQEKSISTILGELSRYSALLSAHLDWEARDHYLQFFGQPIPANKEGRFSSWSNITDIIDNLPAIGE